METVSSPSTRRQRRLINLFVSVKTGFAFTNKWTDGDNSEKLLLGKGFPWGHSLAAGRTGIYYGC